MLRLLPLILLVACAGNHRPVGTVDAPIPDAATITQIELENVAGTINVRAADQSGASVLAKVLLVESRPETDFTADFTEHVEMVRTGDRLKIRNRHGSQADSNDWQLQFTVKVPAGKALAIDQTAGTVNLQLPSARDVEINNTAGEVTVAIPEIDGQLVVGAEAGIIDLQVSDRGPTGGVELRCTAGEISLQLPKDVHGEFDLAATTGNIDLASRFGLDAKRDIASVAARGTVGQGGKRFRIRTTAGNIVLK